MALHSSLIIVKQITNSLVDLRLSADACRKAIQFEQTPGARLDHLKDLEAQADATLQKTQADKAT